MTRKVEWQIQPEDQGIRLDAALARQVEDLSRSHAQRAIRDGLIRVDGETETRPSLKLKSGTTIEAMLPEVTEHENRPALRLAPEISTGGGKTDDSTPSRCPMRCPQ